MTLVPVRLYRIGPFGRVLERTDFLDARECHACNGTQTFVAWREPVLVRVSCPFCWRRTP